MQTAPVVVLLACGAALSWREHGSIAAASWLPYSIAIALVAAIVLVVGVAARPSRAATVGIAALAALGVWAAVSGFWAPSPSLARDEGLLTLTYALVLGIAIVTLWTAERRLVALAAVAAVSGGVAIATAATLVWGDAQLGHYVGGRLAFPISYVNAAGALFAVGVWPALLLAARREGTAVVRAFAHGAAAASLAACLMTQSKGAVLGLIVATVVVLVVSPMRLRLLPPLLIVGGLTAAAAGRLTEPFRVYGDAAISRAGAATLVLALVAVAIALPYALIDTSIRIGARTHRVLAWLALVAAVASVAAGVAAFLIAVDSPRAWFSAKWEAAHRLTDEQEEDTSSHLVQVGSNRFDFWRVAGDSFRRDPVVGEGARSFGPTYLVEGRSAETPRRAHSLPLEVLAEQGIVGFTFFALALGAPFLLALRRAWRGDAIAAAALAGFVAWFVQAGVDWTWTLPADTIPAFVLLGIGSSAEDGWGAVAPRLARGVAALATLVAVIAFAPPWLSARYTQRAMVQRSQSDLDRARLLDPLSTAPLLASVWVEPLQQALPELRLAAKKEPRSVANRYVLGRVYLELGRPAAARRELEAALRLKPGDRLIRNALTRTR